jgi:AAA domain
MPRIADEIKLVVDDPGNWMIWIYGPNGAGKTTLTAQFPDLLMLDTEGSRRSLLNFPDLVRTPFLDVETYGKFRKAVDEIILNNSPIIQMSTVVSVDTLSTLQQKDLGEQMKLVGQKQGRNPDLPSQNEFNINNTRIRRAILELKERSGKNLILVSHIKEVQDDNGTTVLIRPGNSPSLSDSVASLCDGIFYLDSRTDSKGETTRTLKCMPSPKIRAKNRFAATLSREIVNPTGKDILNAIDEQQRLAREYSTEQEKKNAGD